MAGLYSEIGSRGQRKQLPEAVPPARVSRSTAPAPAPVPAEPLAQQPPTKTSARGPAPAPAPASAPTSALAPTQTTEPTLVQHPSSAQSAPLVAQPTRSASGSNAAGGSSAASMDVSAFLDLVDRMQAKADEQTTEWQAKLEAQRHETDQLRQEAFESKLLQPQEVVSTTQIQDLSDRIEAMHAAQLLSDDELFAMEDHVADFLEAKSSVVGVVTMDVANANREVGKLQKIVVLGEGMPKDAMFARQIRRKFV